MNEWDQCPRFQILPQCMPRLNHFGTRSRWQVINHCPQATFPRAAPEQCPMKILEFARWTAAIYPCGRGGSPLPLPQPFNGKVWQASLHIPSGCCLHPAYPLWRHQVQAVSQDLTYNPWAERPQSGWGKGPRFWRAGALKKSPFPFRADLECWLKNGAVVWGPSPGDRRSRPLVCLLMARTFWWIGVWYGVTSRGWWFKEKAFSFHVPFFFSRVFQWVYRL